MYTISEILGTQMPRPFATVASIEAAREFLASAFVNTPLRASLVVFDVDDDADAADALLSNGTMFAIERA